MENLGSIVLQMRKRLGLSQKELARKLGLTDLGERTVRGWEREEHQPPYSVIEKMANMLNEVPFPCSYKDSTVKPRFKFIDLFAGIGGIRMPFQELGGKCVFSSEWDKFARKTYAANYGEEPSGDITLISADSIPNHDILLAGFPCQAFSQAGLRQGFKDTRGTMFFEIQKILADKKPKAFLLENVKQLRGHDGGNTLKTILDILEGRSVFQASDDIPMSDDARSKLSVRLNYQVDCRVLSANNFGVPQKRERIYIVGFDRNQVDATEQKELAVEIFDKLEKIKIKKNLGSVLEDKVPDKYTISDRLYQGHIRRLNEHKEKGNGFGFSVFTKDSEYCNTISARYYKDGSEVLIDQSDKGLNPRKLTPRECAKIQGFPDEFIVDAVSDVQIYKQFGNSVSVPVIRSIAKEMLEFI